MTEAYQCVGCGALIQTQEPNQLGYLPYSALEKGLETGDFYCQRCFRLRHYNELQDLEISDEVFIDRLSSIAQDQAYIIYLVDIFDIEGSLINGLSRLIGHQPFALVANKLDLLPTSVKVNRVKHWVQRTVQEAGLRPEETFLVSAKKASTLQPLLDKIEEELRHQNVYIVGVTNVGKSTLINQLLVHYGGDKEIITTSNHPGTTLDLIKIPVSPETSVIDTPGIIKPSQIEHLLTRSELKEVLPTKEIKPRTYQLNSGQTLFLAGLGRVDFLQGERAAFTYYVANSLYLHRTKLEGADDFYAAHLGGLLQPPHAENASDFPELIPRKIELKPNEDVTISGLGWFTANREVSLRVWVPQGVALTVRTSII